MNNSPSTSVVTRFAPSPTGMFHVGGIRSALYNYLFARKHGGKFILRCEDTDPVRSKPEFEKYFLDVFDWLGLEFDEYYRQSERTSIYRTYIESLISQDKAYISHEDPKEEGQRSEVIRFRNPNTIVTFEDLVLGPISFDTKELGDFVIARDIDSPLYHFTVVVDDHEMGITHIIRGQEHVSNTPRQILIQDAIGAKRPYYAHASVILNEERAKLSKRDPSVRPALEYKEEGYLPLALLNFMALLGWNPGTPQEVFTRDELVSSFSIERMQKPGAIFNSEKLEWFNREHLKLLDNETRFHFTKSFLGTRVLELPQYSDERLERALFSITDRLKHFGELRIMADAHELDFYFVSPVISDSNVLLWKTQRTETDGLSRTRTYLSHVLSIFQSIQESDWTLDTVRTQVWPYAEEHGRGDVLWPTRFALAGVEKSPDPFTLAYILGKTESEARISLALTLLHE